MIRFRYPRTFEGLARGKDALVCVAPERYFRKRGALKGVLDAESRKLLLRLGAGLEPGLSGQMSSTLSDGPHARVFAAVLPDSVSRYNSAAQPAAVQRLVQAAGLSKNDRVSLLFVVERPEHVVATLNALGRAFPMYSEKKGGAAKLEISVAFANLRGAAIPVDAVAREILDSAREAARLVDSPPTMMNPERLATEIRRLVRGVSGIRARVISGAALEKEGLMGIHSVGRCAVKAPRMLVLEYRPARAKGRHIAFVGKGVTFDTGGLHLKGRGSMESMKCDMGGAAAVAGAFRALVRTKVKRRLSLVVCLAENAIGPTAYKPDDVLRLHSGLTVEINNTDAEGRLLLSDGVSYAARKLKADVVVDAATLTGAQMIATGTNHAAVFSNDERLEASLVDAGRVSGDLVHPLPFAPEFYKPEFRSTIADMKNSVKNRVNAQSSCAAQFIHNHLEGTDTTWGHVDLAGPAFRAERGTGFGVALLADLARRID